ncbi:LysR family transcriptional regulator [Hwanghaeella sp. 1Z406]|uniref:LysR family transcriptional regulator n=1 Tax=Hwanghaeella sp. 1Z406 TaxID=3402811 RepID=UPI0026ADA9F8|tara:strand:- start:32999 stop:33895 length:897 start_codon:yes stop_codon:yes gene_type:complete
MKWTSITFDWNLARAFLVTAQEGSFSAASRALGLTQPTLGRQVAALEQHFDVALFERTGRRLTLTASGRELLDHVQAMGEAATQISLTASGHAQSVEGHVCITATDGLAANLLPPALKKLRQTAPGITVEIIASTDVQDLKHREADIAIRHIRPTQGDLIAKFIRNVSMRLYATTAYLDQIGRPGPQDDLTQMSFIGYERSNTLIDRLVDMGLNMPSLADQGALRITCQTEAVAWAMVQNGLGLGVMPEEVADRVQGIERAFPRLAPMAVPIWLVAHRELRTNRRIRIVFDVLSQTLA